MIHRNSFIIENDGVPDDETYAIDTRAFCEHNVLYGLQCTACDTDEHACEELMNQSQGYADGSTTQDQP